MAILQWLLQQQQVNKENQRAREAMQWNQLKSVLGEDDPATRDILFKELIRQSGDKSGTFDAYREYLKKADEGHVQTVRGLSSVIDQGIADGSINPEYVSRLFRKDPISTIKFFEDTHRRRIGQEELSQPLPTGVPKEVPPSVQFEAGIGGAGVGEEPVGLGRPISIDLPAQTAAERLQENERQLAALDAARARVMQRVGGLTPEQETYLEKRMDFLRKQRDELMPDTTPIDYVPQGSQTPVRALRSKKGDILGVVGGVPTPLHSVTTPGGQIGVNPYTWERVGPQYEGKQSMEDIRADLVRRLAADPNDAEAKKTLAALAEIGSATRASETIPYRRADVERALTEAGWRPDMPGYGQAYLNVVRQIPVPQGGAVYGGSQLIVPPPRGGAVPVPAPAPGSVAVPPGSGMPGGGGPLIERAQSPEQATHFINKDTWEPPPPGMTPTQIQRSGKFVQAPSSAIPALAQGRVVKGQLDALESIVERRPDLFPVKTGNKVQDGIALAKAEAYWRIPKIEDFDPDVAQITSLKITLPSAIKVFGDTGNIAIAERAIAEAGLGLRPAMQDAAFGRVDLIRSMINARLQTAGLPAFGSVRKQKGGATTDVDAARKALGLGAR